VTLFGLALRPSLSNRTYKKLKGKGKGKIHPETDYEGPEEE
jgi:hypothetical protein